MKTTIALATATLFSMSSMAFAAGHAAEVRTPSGKTVWYLGGALGADDGSNPSLAFPGPDLSPRGNTGAARPGLVTALSQDDIKGLSVCSTDADADNSCD